MGRICEVIMNPLKRLHDQFVHWYYRNIFKRPSFRKCLIGIGRDSAICSCPLDREKFLQHPLENTSLAQS